MELPADYRFGEARVRVEGELLRIWAHGTLSPEVALQFIGLGQQLLRQHGRFFVLIDLNQAGGIPPAVRRLVAEQLRLVAPCAVAFYGGTVVVRAVNALLIGAVRLVSGGSQNLAIFNTEEQAQTWLARQGLRPVRD